MRNSTALTLGQAAKAIGRDKPTVLRALQKGTISGVKDEAGRWAIEPAELFRIFPPVTPQPLENPVATTPVVTKHNPTEPVVATPDNGGGAALVAALRDQIADIKADRERERATADELRRLLDEERAERGRLVAVIEKQAEQVKLLTDQRKREEEVQAKMAEPPPAPKGLLRRLFGG